MTCCAAKVKFFPPFSAFSATVCLIRHACAFFTSFPRCPFIVMPGLDPGIHVFKGFIWSSFPHLFHPSAPKRRKRKKSDETKPIFSFVFKELNFFVMQNQGHFCYENSCLLHKISDILRPKKGGGSTTAPTSPIRQPRVRE